MNGAVMRILEHARYTHELQYRRWRSSAGLDTKRKWLPCTTVRKSSRPAALASYSHHQRSHQRSCKSLKSLSFSRFRYGAMSD